MLVKPFKVILLILELVRSSIINENYDPNMKISEHQKSGELKYENRTIRDILHPREQMAKIDSIKHSKLVADSLLDLAKRIALDNDPKTPLAKKFDKMHARFGVEFLKFQKEYLKSLLQDDKEDDDLYEIKRHTHVRNRVHPKRNRGKRDGKKNTATWKERLESRNIVRFNSARELEVVEENDLLNTHDHIFVK